MDNENINEVNVIAASMYILSLNEMSNNITEARMTLNLIIAV